MLFKLRPDILKTQIDAWLEMGKNMVGEIPGLQEVSMNPPFSNGKLRTQGFSMCLVAILDQPDSIDTYMAHNAHLRYVSSRHCFEGLRQTAEIERLIELS